MTARIYLDHAATTPMVPAAIEAMAAQLGRIGNPSSLHASGRAARRVIEDAREQIAECVGAQPAEVIFTSGGTEADNLVIKGGWAQARRQGRQTVITSAIDHHAVLDSVTWLGSAQGARVQTVTVDEFGRLDLGHLKAVLEEAPGDVGVISIMAANNETGVLQPLTDVVRLGHEAGALVHSDAVQSVGHLPFDFAGSGLDACTFTAHKLGGPVGIGALLLRRETNLDVVQHGGGQERDLRSGTLDVAGAAGFASAVKHAVDGLAAEAERVTRLRNRLVTGVLASVPDATLNGPALELGEHLPGVVNLEFAGADADAVLMLLDRAGIDCSAGSACSAGLAQPSSVLLAMGRDPRAARSAVRFSLGHTTGDEDVAALLAALPEAVERARLAS